MTPHEALPEAQSLFDQLPDAALVIDEEGVIRRCNQRVHSLLGYQADELTGQPVEALMPAARRGAHRGHRARFQRRETPTTMSVRGVVAQRADGSSVPVDVVLAPFGPDGAHILAMVRDVTHLRQLEDELRASNEQLTALNEKKNHFLGMAAHDLRNPLTAVLGFARLLGECVVGPLNDDQKQLVSRIERQADFMRALVDELLDVSTIEAGNLVLRHRDLDVERLVQEVLVVQRMIADRKGTIIKLHAPGDLPLVSADAGKVEQILHNLVSNAIKYSPRDTRIDVTVARTHSGICVRVQDQGIGIEPDEIESIFEPYGKGQAPTDGEQSTGLGLAIARRMARAHGGDIIATSQPGRGSAFLLRLPLAETPTDGPMQAG